MTTVVHGGVPPAVTSGSGTTGAHGVPTDLGPWNVITDYQAGEGVVRNGQSYYALSPSQGVDPEADDGTHWLLFAKKGADGAPGTGTGVLPTPTSDDQTLVSKAGAWQVVSQRGWAGEFDLAEFATNGRDVYDAYNETTAADAYAVFQAAFAALANRGGAIRLTGVVGVKRGLVCPNNISIVGPGGIDSAAALDVAYDSSTPPFRWMSVLKALPGFVGNVDGALITMGTDVSASPNPNNSGAHGNTLKGFNVDGGDRAANMIVGRSGRAFIIECGLSRCAPGGNVFKTAGGGVLVQGCWVSGNQVGGGNCVYHGDNDCHLIGNRFAGASVAVYAAGAGLYMIGNHPFPFISPSRNIVIAPLADAQFFHIASNVIDGARGTQIHVVPAAGAKARGIDIVSNEIYYGNPEVDQWITMVFDASAAGASIVGLHVVGNESKPMVGHRQKALVNAKGTISDWTFAMNKGLAHQRMFLDGSLLPDVNTGNTVNHSNTDDPTQLRFSSRKFELDVTHDGSAQAKVPHLCDVPNDLAGNPTRRPRYYDLRPGNQAAADAGEIYLSADQTNVYKGLTSPPAAGTVLRYVCEVEV